MGIIKSKFNGKKQKTERNDSKEASDEEEVTISSWELYDMDMVKKLRKEFKNHTDTFILNNLLMSIMFFESYENGFLSEPATKDSSKINPILLKEHQKSYIKPDILSEEINRNVRFRRRNDGKKEVSQPLLSQRMIIMYDNIRIDDEDEDHYSDIDKPTFKAQLVHAEKKGYIKLKCVKDVNDRKASILSQTSNQTCNSDESTIINNPDAEVYGYEPINDARTPKPLGVNQNVTQFLPKSFIKTVKVKIDRDGDKDDDDDKDEDEDKKYYLEYYLDSKVLMKHFRKVGFQEELGKVLGFTKDDFATATYTTTDIFFNESLNSIHWEIIPAVLISWPSYHAYEWYKRADRPTVTAKNKREYQWPSDYMLREIIKFNCIVIPRGYLPKKGPNKGHNLEWEIGFPQAEKFMETQLAHAHVRSFLFLVAIFKTFIEPKTERKGLLAVHIKTLIFWEIERNALSWPDNKLGAKILHIIKNLCELLGSNRLPDYFIRDRNLFENIPNNKLWEAQDVLSKIMQSPVMYFITALKNLEYVKKDFYQFPDLNELQKILMDDAMKNTNPGLYKQQQSEKKSKSKEEKDDSKKKKNKNNVEEEKDPIDFRWTFNNKRGDEIPKTRLILIFFLDHFLTIVRDSIVHNAFQQASFYAKHCFYLTKLLAQTEANKIDAEGYFVKINTLQMEIHKKQTGTENPPVTPSRNSCYVPKTSTAPSATVLPESNAADVIKRRQSKSASITEQTVTDKKVTDNSVGSVKKKMRSISFKIEIEKPKIDRSSMPVKSVAFDTEIEVSEI